MWLLVLTEITMSIFLHQKTKTHASWFHTFIHLFQNYRFLKNIFHHDYA